MEIGSSGKIYNKKQVIDALRNETTFKMTISEFQIKILSENVVLTTFRLRKFIHENNQTAYSLRSSIWKLSGSEWKMVFHQGTPETNL